MRTSIPTPLYWFKKLQRSKTRSSKLRLNDIPYFTANDECPPVALLWCISTSQGITANLFICTSPQSHTPMDHDISMTLTNDGYFCSPSKDWRNSCARLPEAERMRRRGRSLSIIIRYAHLLIPSKLPAQMYMYSVQGRGKQVPRPNGTSARGTNTHATALMYTNTCLSDARLMRMVSSR